MFFSPSHIEGMGGINLRTWVSWVGHLDNLWPFVEVDFSGTELLIH